METDWCMRRIQVGADVMEIRDLCFCIVCHAPRSTMAFGTKIPCFAMVLMSGCWVFGYLIDPGRQVIIGMSIVIIFTITIMLTRVMSPWASQEGLN